MRKTTLCALLLGLPALAAGGIAAWGARRLTLRRPTDPPADPAALGLPYEDAAFTASDGIALRGWFMPAERRRGTIIFLHGQAGSMDADLRYAPAFHNHGYNVLMFDFRGHGRSGGRWVSFGYYERLDVLAAIAYLRGRGIDSVGLLGFSMGGAVAMATAPLSPAVRAVVSDGGFARLESTIVGWLREKKLPAALSLLLARLFIGAASLRLGCSLPATEPLRWVGRIAPRGLFLIQGGSDRYVPPADAEALYARAGAPKQLWIEPGADHREVAQVAPAEYLPRILEFFDRFFPEPAP